MKSLSQHIFESLMNNTDKLFTLLSTNKFKTINRNTQTKLISSVNKESDSIANSLNSSFKADDKQISALDHYVSIAYQKINQSLRNGSKLDAKLSKIIDQIDNVINSNKLNHELIVYRGVSMHDQSNSKAYTSTSIDPYTAYSFARGENSTIKKYSLPKGTNYAWIGGGEKEILLPRDFNIQKYEIN